MDVLYYNIRRRRKELKMTQSELAAKTGYKGKSMIARIENGEVDLANSKIEIFARALNTKPTKLMGWTEDVVNYDLAKIPVLGNIPPEIPLEKIPNIEDTPIFIDKTLLPHGQYYGLRVHGKSMQPSIKDNDRVIFRVTSDCKNGDVVVARIGDNSATLKKFICSGNVITLQSINPEYSPIVFTGVESEPKLEILGIVIQMIRDM